MRTDAELVAAWAGRRDEAAFAEIVGRHWAMVCRACLRVLGDAQAAEDVAQAAFIVLARKAGSLRGRGDLAAWLHWVARNAALRELRARTRRTRREEEAAMIRARDSGAALSAGQAGELRAALDRELLKLPAEQRVAVLLRYLEGFSQEEAAAVAGCPQGTLARRATLGLERLRARLSRGGAPLSAAALIGFLGAEAAAPASAVTAPAILAAAGAAGGKASLIAEGTMKAMFWMKMKLAAAVLGGVAVLGGGAASVTGLLAAESGNHSPPAGPASPPAPGGAPRHEHVACIDAYGLLDGPAKEAIGFRGGLPDTEGNVWSSGRWLRGSDNRMLRLATYEYGTFGFDLKEGPIAGRPVNFVGASFGWPCGGSAIIGRPDSGGKTDGVYEALGEKGLLIRIWKNQEKGGRWWYARAAGSGAAEAPKTKGQSADALAVKFKWLNMPQIGLDGKLRFMADSSFYLLEDGKVTCLLSPEDYKAATDVMKNQPNEGYFGGDGTFYLGYYYTSGDAYNGKAPAIWRVTPDGKVEPFAKRTSGGQGADGAALTQADWFCGPHLGRSNAYTACRFIPPDAMLTSAHDEDEIRRIQNGRVATLCTDGEWREMSHVQKPVMVISGPNFGPNGVVYHGHRPYEDSRYYRYTGIDFSKPPVSKREGGGK